MNTTSFSPGAGIRFTNGMNAIVEQELGSGGQGTVYRVQADGGQYALKWYKKMPSEAFVRNLSKNVEEGSPSELFLWPQAVSRTRFGSIGYLMPLKPEGFEEFSRFRLAKVRFTSLRAMFNAALEICEAFKLLHAKGLSYQDLNDGGFFIHPLTGQVRICDCDNVFPHGDSSGVLGKARYMAPEVVLGKTMPDSYTDRFSMSLMLFMIFCIDHPFEGANVLRYPCLTEELERHLFGDQIRFIFDPADAGNRPVRGVHHNALVMWPLLPRELRETFQKEFSAEKLANPDTRLTEMQWIDILQRNRNLLACCPKCGTQTFVEGKCLNPMCSHEVRAGFCLTSAQCNIPLQIGQWLSLDRHDGKTAFVIDKPGEDLLLLQNLTEAVWQVHTLSGKTIDVPGRGYVPVKPGLQIDMPMTGGTRTFAITLNNPTH